MKTTEREQVIKRLFQESGCKGAIRENKIQEIIPLAFDASARKYYRVRTALDSYVICLDKPFLKQSYPFLEIQKFLALIGIRVPHIYDFNEENGYLLEEDLGDNTLLSYSTQFTVKQELEMYKRCIDLMIQFQSHNLENDHYSFQQLSFDQKKLNGEIDFAIEHFFRFLMGSNVNKWSREIAEIRKDLKKINNIISEKEMVFTHRDFHSRNIMVKDNELVVIDFQDSRLGLPQYDLVSLIDDCYYELDDVNKENIKKYYFGQLAQLVDDQKSYPDFSYFYDVMCIQRIFKVLGTFSFIFYSRSDERYLKYIAFAFEKLKKVMWKYPDFYTLRKNLVMIYYGN